jgi:tRNA(Ile)-lysidine synthase TilS/MesJ
MANKNKVVDIYEQAITTKFRPRLWSRFIHAIKEYHLIEPGDHICVCISGGKDSMLMARLFMQLEKHSDFEIKVTYLVMDPGYSDANRQLILDNLKKLSIPATIIKTDIFEIANMQTKSPCFLCAKMRRGALYNNAKALGCNKIALGHHYDDVIETTLMNLLNAGSFQTMLPKVKSTNYEGMTLIRPMYLIRERDIIGWKNYHELQFLQCACKFTERCANENDKLSSQRAATKKLIKTLVKEYNPMVEKNLFKAPDNVTLDMIMGYKQKGKYYSFLNDFSGEHVYNPYEQETKKKDKD